ncbi:DUF262 domain-containing protein [Listeria cossartiae]|uniref:DUF262 domain-containing protein n=1 Tax=Listeria cossartiae TaxID=2838249 RepID=UPI00287FFC78|nr:DUF262 domain-containing protein [Listeria cossartiae]MDT0013705.1 DUF262 domain-containing protein [Listeria cossartiae subsp. cayugensis]
MNLITAEQKKKAEQQILNLQERVDYDIRDYPIEFIVSKYDSEDYFIPDYQREFIWSSSDQARFIESLLLDLPIPLLFLSDTDEGKLEIVDGVQRINTLSAFLSGKLVLCNLKKLTEVNAFNFNNLPPSQQRRLQSKALRVIVLRASTSEDIRKELFDRLNTSGEKAKDSEVRRGSFEGDFMTFIENMANLPKRQLIAPVSPKNKKRREHIELVLRFFAYANNYKNFKHGVQVFIDDYIKDVKDSFSEMDMEADFLKMLSFAEKYFPIGFKKTSTSKTVPRVRFEALSVGIILALRDNADLVPEDVNSWINSEEFKKLTTSDGSNSKVRVKERIEYVKNKLLEK